MLLEVSIGEALDKLSILELKSKYINDKSRRGEVEKEIKSIGDIIAYKDKYNLQYKLLYHVNEKIWMYQDDITSNKIKDTDLVHCYNTVFKLNQKRFRIKNIVNNLENSIKEQKGYALKTVYILFDYSLMPKIIPTLLYIMLDYDVIYTKYDIPILNPFIIKRDLNSLGNIDIVNLNNVDIPPSDNEFYNSLS
jgi:hypothetical protein